MLTKLSDGGTERTFSQDTRVFKADAAEVWERLRSMLCFVPKNSAFVMYAPDNNNRYSGCIFGGCTGYWSPANDSVMVKGRFMEFSGFSSVERCLKICGADGRETVLDVQYDRILGRITVFSERNTQQPWSTFIKDVRVGYSEDGSPERYEEIDIWGPRRDVGQTQR